MPADRTKKTKAPEAVPNVGDPDRKRVLNVLAQRRYRQRRREKIAALEAHAKSIPSPDSPQHENEEVPIDYPNSSSSKSNQNNSLELSTIEEGEPCPANEMLPMFDFDQDTLDMNFTTDFTLFPNLPSPIPSTPDQMRHSYSSSNSPLSMPISSDGAVLSLPILGAIRSFATIAIALDVASHIWDPFYLHVLPPSHSIPALHTLPANLHPVAAQFTIPHHPVLDLLPWPSVREKLIVMLSLPSAIRPPVAQEVDDDPRVPTPNPISLDPLRMPDLHQSPESSTSSSGIKQSTAIVQLVQDLDDFQDGGGVRVHGNMTAWGQGNELIEESWEIGDVFYRKWWWCLDQRVVDVSNKRRRERGLGRLRLVEVS